MNQNKKDPFCIVTVQYLLQLLSQSPQIKSIFTLKKKKIKERDQHRARDHQFKILSMCTYQVKAKIKVWHLTAEKKRLSEIPSYPSPSFSRTSNTSSGGRVKLSSLSFRSSLLREKKTKY